MLMPKKTKYRKEHKRYHSGQASSLLKVSFGAHGLKALEGSWVSSRQIEAARRVMTKYTKKGGKIWIRMFPDKPVTLKGGEIPMGKGKGAVDHYVAIVKPGMVMFEIAGIDEATSKKALELAAYKLPVKCKFVSK
ncbi:MAG: 50S ribosomal protein L16 [Candidatus Pacebacteria bacterium]|nr:50S ribosomal protein L16 [Candidatus Paceibacterota bacterium]